MDGISPTLAFAVLLFGLSDGARDPGAEAALEDRPGCPMLAITGDPISPAPSEDWADAFLPHVIEPKWEDPVDSGVERPGPVDDHVLAATAGGADPIFRRTITVGATGVAGDGDRDPCALPR
jgi:hypothetical protein